MTPCHDKSGVHAAFPYRTYRTAFVTGAALTRGKRASTARRLSLTNVFPGGIRTRDRLPTQRHLPCQPCAHRALRLIAPHDAIKNLLSAMTGIIACGAP